ncbi:MAG: DMT family transporter [Candidatus Velthaea sp.]
MVIVLSLAAALTYGAADFFGGLASRRVAVLTAVASSQAVGLGVLLVCLPFVRGTLHASDLAWGLASGIAGATAIVFLYRGLAIGSMGIVSPITAVLAAAIPVIFGLARGERPALGASIGIVCALLAVVLVSLTPGGERKDLRRSLLPPGMREAFVSGSGFGFFFIALAQTSRGAGLFPLLGTRVVSVAILFAIALFARAPLVPAAGARRTILACGILDMSANVLYVFASHTGLLSVAAVLTSLYPAATVALAALVVGERLLRMQWIGVGVALAGVILIASARAAA